MRFPTQKPSEAVSANSDALASPRTRLYGRWLWLARAGWLTLVLLTLGLYLLSVPISFTQVLTVCTSGQCDPGQLTPKALIQLQQLGLTATFFALYFTFTNALFVLVSLSVAAVIFWRRSNDWLALLGSLMLVTFGIATFSGALDNLAASEPNLQPVAAFINFCGAASLLVFFYLFPNGRFEPRWTRWLLIFFFGLGILSAFFINSSTGDNGPGILYVLPIGSVVFVQMYRYLKVSGSVERQQTKWVVFGTTVALGGFVGLVLLLNLLGSDARAGRSPSILVAMIVNAAFNLSLALVPISLMIAILRYRLWDIDLLINRTLVYVPLTGILAGIFAASITLTQKFFIALTGQSSDAATVLTTLIVVSAFDPLKTGLQHLVERRFKETADPAIKLRSFRHDVESVVQVFDAEQISRRFLEAVTAAYDASGGIVTLDTGGNAPWEYAVGSRDGNAKLELPLDSNGRHYGVVRLSARRNGADYSPEDVKTLRQDARLIADAISLAEWTNGSVR